MSLRPLLLIHGVLEMLGTSLRGPPLPKHRQRWRRHVLPSVPGRDGGCEHHCPDIREPVLRSRTMLALLAVPSLQNSRLPSARAIHYESCAATRTHRPCRRLIP